jgi:hypothetical protein
MATRGSGPVVLWNGEVSPFGTWIDGTRTWVWRWAPAGLATRRQLAAMRLRPGGQEPYGRIVCRRGRRWAWLYRLDLAQPKRQPTPAVRAALAKAMAARRWCESCSRDVGYCVPRVTLGSCVDCWLATQPGQPAEEPDESWVSAWAEHGAADGGDPRALVPAPRRASDAPLTAPEVAA